MFSCWQEPEATWGEDVFLLAMAGGKMGRKCFLAGKGRRQNGAKMFSCRGGREATRGERSDDFLGGPKATHQYCNSGKNPKAPAVWGKTILVGRVGNYGS